jgi:DNA-binding NarL/FixJ family response regulator
VPEGSDSIRVLIADGQPLFRDAVKAVLESEEDVTVVALAGDGVQAVHEAERVRPDVAILDLNLPNSDGIRTTTAVLERVPACRVLVLADADDQTSLLAAVEAGASGFLTRESPLAELISAARTIHGGETLIPGRMLGSLLSNLVRRRREQESAFRLTVALTRRERVVLGLIAEGADNDQIARILVISPQTVRTHIHNLLVKIGVHSRLEAAAFVRRNGIREELGAMP